MFHIEIGDCQRARSHFAENPYSCHYSHATASTWNDIANLRWKNCFLYERIQNPLKDNHFSANVVRFETTTATAITIAKTMNSEAHFFLFSHFHFLCLQACVYAWIWINENDNDDDAFFEAIRLIAVVSAVNEILGFRWIWKEFYLHRKCAIIYGSPWPRSLHNPVACQPISDNSASDFIIKGFKYWDLHIYISDKISIQ